jgi:oligoendopeptidase F
MESCEIDSMSMEFFAEPWMNLFFDVPDKYRYAHLAEAIEFLPYGVTVDEFQHWVYANPNATPDERDAEWAALEEKYTPYKVKAKEGMGWPKRSALDHPRPHLRLAVLLHRLHLGPSLGL